MKYIAKTGLLLLLAAMLLLPCALPGALAAGSVSEMRLNQVQQVGSDVTMYVSMTDAGGNPCTNDDYHFTQDQFLIQMDREPLTITGIQTYDPSKMGIQYIFSVDISRTITAAQMANIREQLTDFAYNKLGPNDTAALITFGEDVRPVFVDAWDRDSFVAAVQSMEASDGWTALYKGTLVAVETASNTGGRTAVIIITDGKNDPDPNNPEVQTYTKESIFDRVRMAQVPLYSIGLNDKGGVDQESLQDLANVSGGAQFVKSSDMLSSSLDRIHDIMCSSVELHTTLVNKDGKSGFAEMSTFKAGYETPEGMTIASNDLQQAINWLKIPVPTVAPTNVPDPKIKLELSDNSLDCVPEQTVTITGTIVREQGEVDQSLLRIVVNGENWEMVSLGKNGDDYVFKAKGVVHGDADTLEVQAVIQGTLFASNYQKIKLVFPKVTEAPAAPTDTPAPTAVPDPKITLQLNEREIDYVTEGRTRITGTIVREQGVFDENLLQVYVNDQLWQITSLSKNGDDYVFTAEGVPSGESEKLTVQVKIADTPFASNYSEIKLIMPTPEPTATPTPAPTAEPTATPEPVISVEMDALNNVIFEQGKSVTVSGVVNVEGEINGDQLQLFIGDEPVEGAVFTAISGNQYEFSATVPMTSADLQVRVRLGDSNISSRLQKVPLATASPTPAPQLTLRLNITQIVYAAGEPVTLSGSIDVVGAVEADNLALYVNGMNWKTEMQEQGNGSFVFTAENALSGDVSKLDVWACLKDSKDVRSNVISLMATTPTPSPEPEATATPTPRPITTPEPVKEEEIKATATPTAVPVTPEPTPAGIVDVVRSRVTELINSGKIWIVVAALALLLVLIALLIVLLVKRSHKKKDEIQALPKNWNDQSREGRGDAPGTVREEDAELGATVSNDAVSSGSERSGGASVNGGSTWLTDDLNGTVRLETTQESGGTVRLDNAEDEEIGGTERLDEEEIKSLDIRMEENYKQSPREPRNLNIRVDEDLVFGRSSNVDVTLADLTVSQRHMMLSYDGEHLFVTDMKSTNGTKLNGQKVEAQMPQQMNSGDVIELGKTELKFIFDTNQAK